MGMIDDIREWAKKFKEAAPTPNTFRIWYGGRWWYSMTDLERHILDKRVRAIRGKRALVLHRRKRHL